MTNATLRIWIDHPFSARFLDGQGGVFDQMSKAAGCAKILGAMSKSGWTVEYEESDDMEICWVATKEFETPEEVEPEARRLNPERWGTLLAYDNEAETDIEVW